MLIGCQGRKPVVKKGGVVVICSYNSPTYEDVLWAKKSDKHGVFRWLPLKQHLIDVSGVMLLLWEHWLSRQQRWVIINSLNQPSADVARNLAGFLGAVHDIGKATPAFQSKPSFYTSPDLERALLTKLERVGFVGLTDYYNRLMSPAATPHALAGQALLHSYGVNLDIGSIVAAHHGTPPDSREEISSQLIAYANNYFQEQNKDSTVHRKWKKVQRDIFDWALTTNGFATEVDLPKIAQPGQVLLSGLLIMADWIASNEEYFPLITLDQTFIGDPETRKKEGWEKWHRTLPRVEEEHIDSRTAYIERFGFEPRDFQTKFFDIVQQTVHPGIFIVEAPMGSGKTEAALIGAEQLSAKVQASGLFFGLPSQATSDGIFDRIRAWLENLDERKKSLQLVHGKAALNDSYASLPSASVYDEIDGSVVVNEWFTGRKRAVLDDFVVGTVDQFLLSALKQKHIALRHLGFSKKVIVIDEVHAYDAYMSQYLYQALRWMGAYNVPVIILSATLPAQTRVELVKHYMRGRGIKWRDVEHPEDWVNTDAYPLITFTAGMTVKQYSDFASPGRSQVAIARLDEHELIETLAEQLQDGGIAGIIVNTVKRAQKIAELCSFHFGNDLIELLHSNFIATHRVEKETQLLKTIGKGVERPKKKIIIGTQVLEQSLDIDFDLLISDLAPMDLLLQRMGRLHRHSLVERPQLLQKPKVFVLGTSDTFQFEPGSSAVYGDYLLMRTQLLLPRSICLPDDISPLVQAVYGQEDEFNEEELLEQYKRARDEHESTIKKKEHKAKAFLLKSPSLSSKSSLIGWLKDDYQFDTEEWAVAQVRDTQETIEVIALQKYGDGYTIFGGNQDLSLKIDSPFVQKNISRQTLRLPLILSTHYNIEQTIAELEDFYRRHLAVWEHSTWLRGMLGIIFAEDNEFLLNGFRLKYCHRLGLIAEKLKDD